MIEKHLFAIEELNKMLLENWRADSPEALELLDLQTTLGLTFDGRPTCPFLRPFFIERPLYSEISLAAETIAAAERNLTFAALEDDSLFDLFALTEREERLARIDPGYRSLTNSSRFDTFISQNGFKFLEYNAETPAGVGDQAPLELLLEKIPEVREFLSRNSHWRPKPHQALLRSLFTSYREFGGKKTKPNIAIIDWENVSTGAEFVVLQDYFESNGFRTLIVDPSEIDYDGKTLRAASFEIDILYKRILIHEFLEAFGDDHPLIRAYEAGNLCMCNSFRVKIPHKKASFAILSDEKFAQLFTNHELEAIRKHVPWTRIVRDENTTFEGETINLLEFIRAQRERFLLKPNDDYGGKGISLGWEMTESDWEASIAEAVANPFVVQERASLLKDLYPVVGESVSLEELLVDFDPFLFQEEVEGGMVRLSSSSLVNVTQGGGQTALIVLE